MDARADMLVEAVKYMSDGRFEECIFVFRLENNASPATKKEHKCTLFT
jgi:hypothetical protein